MRARSERITLLRRVEGWIFAPGSARQLAAARIGLCLLPAVRLARPLYGELGGQPRALFRPISFMRLFSSMPGPNRMRLPICTIINARP